MPNRTSYIEFLLEQLAPLGEISTRGMFSGHALYCDGVVFALVAENALYLKTDDENQPEFEACGLEPFRPFEGEGKMRYYQAPPELFEDRDALVRWGGGAVAAGRRAAAKKKGKKKPAVKKAKARGRT